MNDLFSSRRSALIQSNRYQYWKAVPVTLSEEQKGQLQELYAQKREVLKLLGVDAPDYAGLFGERPALSDAEKRDLQLQCLPESKRQQVQEPLFHQAEQELAAGSDWHERRGEIDQQTRSQVQSLLTPDEFEEYQLRCSREATLLRGILRQIDPTEEEFRSIFDSWHNLKAYTPATAEYRDAEQASDSALEQLLGRSRFELYVKGVKPVIYAK